MKLLNVLAEEVSEFDQPVQTQADKLRGMQSKVRSLAHHKQILMKQDQKFEELNREGKLTPMLRQQWDRIKAKVKHLDDLLKQFVVRVGKYKMAHPLAQNSSELYSGPPEQYPDLTKSQVIMYKNLQQALAKVGMPPLTVLYGGRRNGTYINFVVTNADSSFAWRKQGSQYSGGNEVIFPGKPVGQQLKTMDFIKNPEKYIQNGVAVPQEEETGAP